MADIRLNLLVNSDGSLNRETLNATRLANELERAARAAARINAGAPTGNRGGSSGGGSGGGSGGAAEAGADSERAGYRQYRGSTGTGAEGRDFARQAEGLGGLVRVYATFAANIFALTAAFSALSKATDTDNMVKGLNQLGAASGKNLGNLSKQLIAASDGAISLKDAMTATAQASAGGLSGNQLLKLADIAKNASQALGRDMPDALSRLTRGITKIEPELLDELGILVKVDAANIEYARSLGKTASSLTDIEKRQAFANAVLTQGEQKFKDIQLVSNPYAKIAASMSNLTQSGLSLVNVVLTPLVNLLSTSPAALAGTLATIAAILIKQAIPALGQWRAGLAASAVTSRETATRINEDFKKFQRDSITRNQPLLAQQLATQEAAIAASRNIMNQEAINSGRKLTAGMREVMSTPIAQINQAQLDRLSREEAALRTRAARFSQEAVDPERSAASQASRAAQAADILNRAENTKKYTQQVQAARTAEAALAADRIRGQEELLRSQTRFGEGRQRQISADRAEAAAVRSQILSNVAQNTQIMGISGAYAKLSEETKAARLEAAAAGKSFTGLASAGTMIRGTFAIATSAINGFMSAFTPWIIAIGLAVAAVSALVEWLGTNNKKVSEFKAGIEALNSSTELIGNTITAINKKPFLERLTVDTIKARSSALSDLAANLDKTFDNLFQADKMASGFDKFIDGWKTLWGGDLRSIASKNIAAALAAGLKAGTDGAARDKFKESIAGLINSGDTSSKGILDALDNVNTPTEYLALIDKLNVSLTTFAKETAKAAEPLVNFASALAETGKAANTLIAGLNLTDPMSKLGTAVITLSNSITKIIQTGPLNSIVALKKLIDTPSEAGFLPPEVFNKMLAFKTSVDSVHSSLTKGTSDIEGYRAELEQLAKTNEDARKIMSTPGGPRRSLYSGEESSIKREDKVKNELSLAEASLVKARAAEKSLVIELAEINKSVFDYGANTLSLALKNAGAQAALSISKAASVNITGEGAADTAYRLQMQEIEIQKQIIMGQMSVAQAMFLNSATVEKNTAQIKLSMIQNKMKELLGTDPAKAYDELTKLAVERAALEKTIKTLDTTAALIKNTKGSQNLVQASKNESPEVRQSAFSYAAPLAGGEAQLTGLAGQEQIAANAKVIAQLKEQTDKKMQAYDLQLKDNSLLSDKLAKSREVFDISEKDYQAEDTKLKIAARSIENKKSELTLESELNVLKTAQAQTGEAAGAASLAITNKQSELDKVRIQDASALAQIKLDSDNKAAEALRLQQVNVQKASLESSVAYGASPEAVQSQLALIDLEDMKRRKATEAEIDAFTIKQRSIEYTNTYTIAVRELSFELDKVNSVQMRTVSLADTMSKAFGKMGTVFGGIVKAYSQSAVERGKIDEKLLNDKKKLDIKFNGDQAKISKESLKLDEAAAADKERAAVDSYANMAGAAKGFFSEKTAAFKAFALIEQVLTLQSMGLQIAALAVDTTTTAGYVANTLVKIGISIKGAIAKALNNVFPYNLIAAGIVVAAAASFGLFSGKGTVPAAPSSEDLEKVQGTGQRYNSQGKLESTGTGVLGDDTAKSESIVKSLELVAKYTFEELEFSNKMLSSLQNIETALTGVSKGLVLTQGLTSGSGFGTLTGKTDGANFFSRLVGSTLGSGSNILSRAFTSVFGGKVSTDITGSGIQLGGNVGQLASGTGKTEQYETGKVTKSGGWFSSDKTSNFKNVANLSDSVKSSLTLTFDTIRDGLVDAGTALGLGSAELIAKINAIPIDVSIELRNLKGKELEDAVTSVLSATMDMITEKALDIVKPYQKMGEGLAETAFRVANDSRVIDLQLKSVSMVFGSIGVNSIAAREKLLELSGGIENFTASSNYFKETFLTDAEKLAPVQKAVTDELARLGLSAVDSREKFKQLVLSLDLSNAAQQNLYVSLMNLEKGFAAVYDASEEVTLSVKELAQGKMTQMIRVMELLGDKTGVVTMQRIQELKSMDARLRPMQKWIYALEDETDARDALTTAYQNEADARQTAIDGLKTSRDTLLDFKKQLTFGAESPLTPGDKYAAAKSDLSQITSVLDNKLSSTEDLKKAIGDLPGAITNLLATSKVFNASSDAYQQDFAYSQKLLETNADNIASQVSTAEASLNALKTQVSALGILDTHTVDINDSIKNLTDLMAKSDAAKYIADLASSGAASAQYLESMNTDKNKTDLQVSAPTDLYIKTLVSNGMAEFTATIAAEMKALKDEVIRLQNIHVDTAMAVVQATTKSTEESSENIAETIRVTTSQRDFNTGRNLSVYA